MQVLPVWQLAIPLPAVLLITVSLYMMVVGIGLWIRYCLKDYCSCSGCCPDLPVCEGCIRLGELCDCRLPAVGALLPETCSLPSCPKWDCACTCHAPDCDTCNCFCFEIRMK